MKSVQLYNELGRALRLAQRGKPMDLYQLRHLLSSLRNEIVTIMAPGVDTDVALRYSESTSEAGTSEEGAFDDEEEEAI